MSNHIKNFIDPPSKDKGKGKSKGKGKGKGKDKDKKGIKKMEDYQKLKNSLNSTKGKPIKIYTLWKQGLLLLIK